MKQTKKVKILILAIFLFLFLFSDSFIAAPGAECTATFKTEESNIYFLWIFPVGYEYQCRYILTCNEGYEHLNVDEVIATAAGTGSAGAEMLAWCNSNPE